MSEVSISLIKSVFYSASKMGLDIALLHQKSGITEEMLNDSEARVSCDVFNHLFDCAIEISGDKLYPLHHGEFFQLTDLDIVGYVCMNASSFREMYKAIAKYEQIVGNGLSNKFIETKDLAYIEILFESGFDQCYMNRTVDKLFASHITGLRGFLNKQVNPLAVYFKQSEPSDISEYTRIFNCPIYFNQSINKIEFSNEVMDEKLSQSNPQLFDVFQKNAEEILKRIEQKKVVSQQVSKEIIAILHIEDTSIETVSSRLNITVRTLQRKLKVEDTSYNELLTSVRKEIAVRHLKERHLSISDISYLLGFSEPSVFHRSFKKWMGKTPNVFRSEQLVY